MDRSWPSRSGIEPRRTARRPGSVAVLAAAAVAAAAVAAATTAAAVAATAAAATTAIAAAATAAVAAATATATAAAAVFAGPGLVDRQGAAAVGGAVQGVDGGLRLVIVGHLDEAEAAAPPAELVDDDLA